MSESYFIYRYIRHDKNVPFYIGMGQKRVVNSQGYNIYSSKAQYYRAYSRDRNKTCLSIMQRTEFDIEIIYETTNRIHAEEKEKEFINMYGFVYDGSGTLVNLTKGGRSFKTTEEYVKNHRTACTRKGVVFRNKTVSFSMYDEDGSYIESFNSLLEFSQKYPYSEKTGGHISACIKHKKSYKGYFFSKEKLSKLDISGYRWIDLGRHPVVQYKDGVMINVFKTLPEAAAQFNIPKHKFGKIVKSGQEINGFVFKKVKLHLLPKN